MTTEFRVGSIQVILDKSRVVESFDAAVAVLFSHGKLMLVRNERQAWEFPGGRKEGDESYLETAAREAYKEAGTKITDIEYLGYCITQTGAVIIITRAEVSSFQGIGGEHEVSHVGLFDRLPPALSCGDGREQLFLEYAKARGT